MVILLPPIAVAIVAAMLLGGRFSNLEQARLRWDWILVLGMVVLAALPMLGTEHGLDGRYMLGIWVLVAVACLFVCGANRAVPWLWLVALGLLANLIVVVANSGMPVMLANLPEGVASHAAATVTVSWLHLPASPATHLLPLADVIPLAFGALGRGMASVGDFMLAIGASATVFTMLLAEPEEAV